MKQTLNYRAKDVVNIYDEVSLWSAPFALLMLQNIPMYQKGCVVDIGFGTGFPLLELRQRFGEKVHFFGIEIWQEAICRAKQKIEMLGLNNIEIYNQLAEEMTFDEESIDMFCSNLGLNNINSAPLVFEKIWKYLKPSGDLVFTINDDQTFKGLFDLFFKAFGELSLSTIEFENYLNARMNDTRLKSELKMLGFNLEMHKTSTVSLRFTSAKSLFDYSLIRIAFRNDWRRIVGKKHFDLFVNRVSELIEENIELNGEFRMTATAHYFHFKKK